MLSHLRHQIPSSLLPVRVDALVLLHVRYCTAVFESGSEKNMQRLQKVLNFGLRALADVNSTTYRTCEMSWLAHRPAVVRTSIPQSPSQNYQYRGTTGSRFPAFVKLRTSFQKHPPGRCFGPPARENRNRQASLFVWYSSTL